MCPATVGTVVRTWPQIAHEHSCTMAELTTGLTVFSTIVLAFNFASLLAFIAAETVLLRREFWLIRNLEENPSFANDHLPKARTWTQKRPLPPLLSLGFHCALPNRCCRCSRDSARSCGSGICAQ